MQSWGRWCSRVLVVGGLVWFVVVAYRYGSFVTVFGDTPCKRDPVRCDERANLVAQRELGRQLLMAGAVLAVGFLATALVRWRAPRFRTREAGATDSSSGGTTSPLKPSSASLASEALPAFLAGFGSVVPLVVTMVFWLFGGTAVYLAVALAWFVLLTWRLDGSLRRRGTASDLGSLLLAGAAAATGIVVGSAAATSLAPLSGPGSAAGLFVLVPVVLALGTGAGAAGVVACALLLARRWDDRAPAVAAPGTVAGSLALVGVLLCASTPVGRALLGGIRSDLYPSLMPVRAAAVAPVLPDPRPDLSWTEPPDPTPPPTAAPVLAARACTAPDLTLSAAGWDSAMGSTAVSVVATNTSSTPCWVRGYPEVRLAQGSTDLGLSLTHSPTQRWGNGDPVPDRRVGLAAHGGRASFDLWWKGYRSAADQQTPQSMTVTTPGTGPMVLGLSAPYLLDVVADAEVTVMRWKVPSLGTG